MKNSKSQFKQTLLGTLALAGAALAPPALAEYFVTAHVNLRAGPSQYYPSIRVISPGTVLELYGCQTGYDWCDVSSGPYRGWVRAAYLNSTHDGQQVAVANNAALLAIPIITFALYSYWDNHYRSYSWYKRRDYWHNYHYHYHNQGRPPGWRPPPGNKPPGWRPPPDNRPPGGWGGSGGSGKPPPGNKPPGGWGGSGGSGKPPGNRPPGGWGGSGGSGKPPTGGGGGSRPTRPTPAPGPITMPSGVQ